MNPQQLLEQFLGADAGHKATQTAQDVKGKLADSGFTGIAGGLAAGGLLGLLVGNKKMRKKVGKLAGGVAGYGGAAALGALGYRAYQNWQANKQPTTASAPCRAQSERIGPISCFTAGRLEVFGQRRASEGRSAVRTGADHGHDCRRRMPTATLGRTSNAQSSMR